MSPDDEAVTSLGPEELYLERELSWLDFNARVLALAEDASLPLLERVKFCAIFSQNLDEFFQVRVSALREQMLAGVRGAPRAASVRRSSYGRFEIVPRSS
ncbi:MAG: hypothetical protein M5T61_08755 [Acidimicrobiia bacterium]|nr:hypothetical protein [Acidimicrobiia bacterium]